LEVRATPGQLTAKNACPMGRAVDWLENVSIKVGSFGNLDKLLSQWVLSASGPSWPKTLP
jgi:hypothetical protein